jgi:hypothetical protein
MTEVQVTWFIMAYLGLGVLFYIFSIIAGRLFATFSLIIINWIKDFRL